MVQKVEILNFFFNSLKKNELLSHLYKKINNKEKTFLVTANPEIVMYANKDAGYKDIIQGADYLIADGYGIILASKILGNPLPERIPGFEIMTALLEEGNLQGWSVYFFGAKEEVVSKAVTTIEERYENLTIAGYHNGYFDWNDTYVQEEIKATEPDLIFVALGFPKQEQWISSNINHFNKGIFIGLGGSFDVLAGEVKRAPLIWQKLNLEWLYRLIKQPSRWRRMLALPHFILKVMKVKFFK
jgi:N-acetylglucosaminyldiphosphoundecaprenol N-acetyl-beta-D-mannosaminyltransferase